MWVANSSWIVDYTDYGAEDAVAEADGVELAPSRKKNSRRGAVSDQVLSATSTRDGESAAKEKKWIDTS
jgi:hypothetical protein